MKTSLWLVLVFCCSLAVYAFTMQPSLSFTDAGELAGACYTLGVAHPTGYPLFVLLGFLWSHLPLPMSVIARLNLMAAVCTAASTVFVFLLSKQSFMLMDGAAARKQQTQKTKPAPSGSKKSQSKKSTTTAAVTEPVETIVASSTESSDSTLSQNILAASTALLYAFAQTVWSQATGIEVYSLHLALMSCTLWLSVRAVSLSSQRAMQLAALMLGLCFSNHLTTILIIVPIVLLFFYRPMQGFNMSALRRKEFLILLGIIVSCSLLYLTLVLNSMRGAWFNWGAVHRGWEQFSYHVFGKQYSVWMFSDEQGVVAKQFKVFVSLLPRNTAYLGLPLALIGLWSLFRSAALRPMAWFYGLLIVLGVAYSVNYNIHDIDSYFLSAYVATVVLSGCGLYALLQSKPAMRKLAALAFVLPVAALSLNWHDCDQHENDLVREYVHMMVDPMPKNAVVFSQQWDFFCSAFWYMQQVEGYRPDVVLVEKELLRRTWFPRQLQRWYPWAIAASEKQIDSYEVDLADFERDANAFQEDAQKVHSIQEKFIAMLNSIVSTNINTRPIYATQEVFEGEKGFAAGYALAPFGLALRIAQDSTLPAVDTASFNVARFAASVKRHHSDHLEKGIAQSTMSEILNNVPGLAMKGRITEAQWFCRQALMIDPTNRTAQDYLNRLSAQH